MDVYVVEWTYPHDGDVSISVWGNEREAYLQACKNIRSYIDLSWDLDEEKDSEASEEFENFRVSGLYKQAIKAYNLYEDDRTADDCDGQYWQVYTKSINGTFSIIAAANTTCNSTTNVVTAAVNDYTCPNCNNNKCSRSEKSCWKCGYSFGNP